MVKTKMVVPNLWDKKDPKTQPLSKEETKYVLTCYANRTKGWLSRSMLSFGSSRCVSKPPKLVMGFDAPTCIDQKRNIVYLNLSPSYAYMSIKEFEDECYANLGHEMGHENYTPDEEYRKLAEKIGDDLLLAPEFAHIPKTKTSQGITRGVGGMLCNICEDGRIEEQFSRVWPGFVRLFRLSNLRIWKVETEQPKNQMGNIDAYRSWERAMISLSVSAVAPKWAKKLAKTDPLRKIINDVRPLFNELTEYDKFEDAAPYFWDVYMVSKQYIIEAIKESMEASPSTQAARDLAQALAEFMMDSSGTSAGGSASGGTPSSSGSRPSKGKGKKGKGSSGKSGGSKKGGKKSEEDEDGSGKKEGEDGAEGEDGDEKGAGSSKEKGDEEGEGTGSGDGSDGQEGDEADGEGGDDDDGVMHPNPTGDNNRSTGSSGSGVRPEPEEFDEEAIDAMCAELEEEQANSPTTTVASVEPLSISDEMEMLYASMGDSCGTQFKEIPRTSWQPKELRPEEALEANIIARAIEKIKAARVHSGAVAHGKINSHKLSKYAAGNYNFFKRPEVHDGGLCVAIAWDGSGSMCGSKQEYSGRACGMIEKAFGNIPMKIINFSVASGTTEHFLVKDFNEKAPGKKSYAYGYARSTQFNGGNKDGYSIRVLTKEILKRNEEKKILFVLSDGLPSDYPGYGYELGIRDVHGAVEEAVKAGVEVIALFFGSDQERAQNAKEYKYMYEDAGARSIDCRPEEIGKKMAKVFTDISLRR